MSQGRKVRPRMTNWNNEDKNQMNIVTPELSNMIRQQMVSSERLPAREEVNVEENRTSSVDKGTKQIRQFMVHYSLE